MELEVKKAQKSFGSKQVLKEVSFCLKTGEILGIFGRNGSGKSTLLRLLFGTLRGSLDMDIDGVPHRSGQLIPKQMIGYLPQHTFLPKRTRVRDIIPMYFYDGAIQDRIFYDPFITTFAHQRVSDLSLGQQRYLGVHLLAQLPHPFVLLDEPFTMIDPLEKENIKKLLVDVKPRKGIIITDHYYRDVLDISTENLVMKNGITLAVSGEEDLKRLGYLASSK